MNSRLSPTRRALTSALCFFILHSAFCISLRAADPPPPPASDLNSLLRDALFEEEATRDLTKAAAGYEALLEKWNAQRQFAAAALYRLAEVRRKQGRKDDAIKLYQRLVTEFADQDPHARLSRENLAAFGAKEPAPTAPGASGSPGAPVVSDEEATALARVQKLAVESPDILTSDELEAAAYSGWLSVVKFIVSTGAKDNGAALKGAATEGHLLIVKELLTLKPLPSHLAAAVDAAVQKNRLTVLKLLLENGASPDGPADSEVPPLAVALDSNRAETVDLLLAHKANVNPPKAARSPLFIAAGSRDPVVVQRLLALGADPKWQRRVTETSSDRSNSNKPEPLIAAGRSTPLHAAVVSGPLDRDRATLLLKAGADPNAANDAGYTPLHNAASKGNVPMIELLLAAGARPDGIPATAGKDIQPPLWIAINEGKVEAVAALLKGKADPNILHNGYSPLAYAIGRPDGKFREAATALLLAHGADPTIGSPNAIYEAPKLALKLPLLRGYQYPKLATKAGITFYFADKNNETTLATRRTPDEQPPTLPTLLLAWHDAGGWDPPLNLIPDWSILRLFRKGADGKMAETLIPIKAGTEFPALQWGDVVEITSKDGAIVSTGPGVSRGNPNFNALPPEKTLAILRGTQTVHVTFKSGDFSRDLTLRGILRVYDPTATEAPLISTRSLVTLIAGDQAGMVKIERSPASGGGIIEWSAFLGEGGTALPEEGDIITFTPDPNPDHRRVTLRIPDHPGRWRNTGDDKNPTLFQVLADFYGPLPLSQVLPSAANNPGAPRAAALKALTPDDLLTNLIQSGAPVSTRPYLPWPDWSSVKIRHSIRSTVNKFEQVDGKPKEVQDTVYSLGPPETINLLAAMAALPADALPEDARKLDIPLKSSDEVEIPLLEDHTDAPWPGFDDATARAFRKALVANVTFSDDTGRFRRVTLQWLPPRWLPTPAGVLPIPDGDATDGRVHWLRARDLADSAAPGYKVAKLTRDGQTHQERAPHVVSEYFLRPGDTLLLTPAARNPGIRPGNNIPRPQISPPAPQPAVPVPQ